MSLTVGNTKLEHGLFLAPLAGYTDAAMRRICRMYGAEYMTTEMVSSRAICYQDKKTPGLAYIPPNDTPCAVQLFGNDPTFMANAAVAVANGLGGGALPCAIDLNMGCPVKKIVSAGDGSALMKNAGLVFDIVSAVVKAVPLPVTVKIRAGWDAEHKNAPEIARAAEAAGASMITVHGRTRADMYGGQADRSVVAAVKQAVSVPVVGNGDIVSAQDALSMLQETGCDGIMIGRGAIGNPFLFAQITAALEGRPYTPPTPQQRIKTALMQVAYMIESKPEQVAVCEARKQLSAYLHGIRGAAAFRGRLNVLNTFEEVKLLAEQLLSSLSEE